MLQRAGQQVVQVGAMDMKIRCAITLGRDTSDGNRKDSQARVAHAHLERLGLERNVAQAFIEPQSLQHFHAIGADLYSRADFTEGLAAFVYVDINACVAEAQRRSEASDSGTDDERLHSAATRTGGSGTEKRFVKSSSGMDNIMR